MEADFSLKGEDGAESLNGVDSFRYLGRILHRSNDNWPVVLRNIWKARQVWDNLGELLRTEGADPFVS